MADPDFKRLIRIETGDITLLRVDTIVNAANVSARSIAPPDPSFSRNAENSAAAHQARFSSPADTAWRLATSTLSARSGRADCRRRSEKIGHWKFAIVRALG
jgi:hypothetical protein